MSRAPDTVAAVRSPRTNQKARTRAALIAAAADLVQEGRTPSIPEAAERALVSVATAYRYFASADDLWAEASLEAVSLDGMLGDVEAGMAAAGDDVAARSAVAASVVGHMLENQAPFRQLAKAALEQWFAQRDTGGDGSVPVRAGRRNRTNRLVVEPLRGELDEDELERLVRALGLVSGTDAMIAVADSLGLDADEGVATVLDAHRWLIAGARAEAKARRRTKPKR